MYTVLIADDEPWVAYGISNLIKWETLGFKIIDTALDGMSALEKVKCHAPDLLISDIRMPGLNGLELMRRIREEQIDTEVVFMSGYTEFEYAQEAVRLGAFDYLVKQVENTDLEAMLKRVAQKLSGKKGRDWDTYFRLFDESGGLTVRECMKILGMECPSLPCRFITLLFDAPIDNPLILMQKAGPAPVLLFRTGTCKLGLLAFGGHDAAGLPDSIAGSYQNAISAGISDLSDGHASFYLLFRQSDIAAGVAHEHTNKKTLGYQAAKRIMEAVSREPKAHEDSKPDNIPSHSRRIIGAIDESFTKDIHITDLARDFYISPNYLCTLVKKETGLTYSDYIITKRIQLAKDLLRQTDLSIQEIIDRIGYRDYAHFCKLFKRREGITPTKYRNG